VIFGLRYIKTNEQGQSFSVFKLLISAIVAFAVLSILLTILPNPRFGRDPGDIAKSMISERLRNPGALARSDVITFETDSALAPSALTEGTGITRNQVCVSMGEYASDESDFEFIGKSLYYRGTSPLDARISVMCDRAAMLQEGLQEFEFEWEFEDLAEDGDFEKCGADCSGNKTCCYIFVRYQ
jgi:hypothetical protein